MSDILVRLRDFLKKLKFVVVCYNSQITTDHSEVDAVDENIK